MAVMGEVSLSGTFLSSLLFQLKNAPGDREGLLLGKVCSHRVNNITDSQSAGQKEEKKICLHSCVCFDKKYSFYDFTFTLQLDEIASALGDRSMDLVGWFSYRRSSSHRLSMKEKALHRKLVHTAKHLQSEDFILCLVTDEVVPKSSVCSTEYSFHSWDGRFRVMNSKMLTLPSSLSYQLLPTRVLPPHLTHYNEVLAQQREHFSESSGDIEQSKLVERLCTAMLDKLEPLKEELISTAERVREASREVEELRQRLALAEEQEREQERTHRQEDSDTEASPDAVSTGVLINLEEDGTTDDVQDEEEPPLPLPPSLTLSSDTVLVPEKLSELHNSTLDQKQDQYLSQELF